MTRASTAARRQPIDTGAPWFCYARSGKARVAVGLTRQPIGARGSASQPLIGWMGAPLRIWTDRWLLRD